VQSDTEQAERAAAQEVDAHLGERFSSATAADGAAGEDALLGTHVENVATATREPHSTTHELSHLDVARLWSLLPRAQRKPKELLRVCHVRVHGAECKCLAAQSSVDTRDWCNAVRPIIAQRFDRLSVSQRGAFEQKILDFNFSTMKRNIKEQPGAQPTPPPAATARGPTSAGPSSSSGGRASRSSSTRPRRRRASPSASPRQWKDYHFNW
jgi:hypothetical protein